MNESFNATIKFALLVLLMLFSASLILYVDHPSHLGAFGIILSILSTFSSYVAQAFYTRAILALDTTKAGNSAAAGCGFHVIACIQGVFAFLALVGSMWLR